MKKFLNQHERARNIYHGMSALQPIAVTAAFDTHTSQICYHRYIDSCINRSKNSAKHNKSCIDLLGSTGDTHFTEHRDTLPWHELREPRLWPSS